MPRFTHDGVEIAFLDEGEGEPIVLVHGFASNKEVNWVSPGWVTTLTRAGRRVIALDNRGHGESAQALRSGRLSQRHHGGGRAGVDRPSRSAARRRHGLFDGRPDHGLPGAFASRARPLGHDRGPGHPPGRRGRDCRIRLRTRSKRRRLADVARSDGLHVSRLRRADQIRPARACGLPARLAPDA